MFLGYSFHEVLNDFSEMTTDSIRIREWDLMHTSNIIMTPYQMFHTQKKWY